MILTATDVSSGDLALSGGTLARHVMIVAKWQIRFGRLLPSDNLHLRPFPTKALSLQPVDVLLPLYL